MSPEEVPDALVEKAKAAVREQVEAAPGYLSDRLADRIARHALAAVLPEIVAKAYRDAADDTERYAEETYGRDDSPFHAQGRFHAGEHATRLRNSAEGWSAGPPTEWEDA